MLPPITPAVKNLMIINVVLFIFVFFLLRTGNNLPGYLPLHSLNSPYFQPFQFVSSMFTHFDIGHIFFNMLTLYFFGPMVEQRVGGKKVFIAYLVGGLFSSILFGLVFTFLLNTPYYLLGASGAVSAVMYAFILFYPMEKIYL